MQCFFILSTASCETEILFYVIDISFNSSSDLVSAIPFFGSTKYLFKPFFLVDVPSGLIGSERINKRKGIKI